MESASSNGDTYTNAAEAQRKAQRRLDVETRIDKIQIIPLYRGTGTYYIDLWCGSPLPQHQTMIVDTGSSTTAMTCLPDCTPSHCGHVQQYHPVFVPHKSSSYQKVNHCNDCKIGDCVKVTNENNYYNENSTEAVEEFECVWNAAYQEGSNWTAFESMEQCYIGGLHTKPMSMRGSDQGNTTSSSSSAVTTIHSYSAIDPNMAAMNYQFQLRFGCQTSLYGNFRTQDTSGIMGLNIGSTAIWNQMREQQIISKRAFSICIQSPPPLHTGNPYSNRFRPSGIMTLGGTHAPIHHHTMVYAQQQPQNADEIGRGLYMIQLQNIYLRPATMTSPEDHTRIDPALLQKIAIPDTQDFVRKVIIDSGTTNTYFAAQLDGPFQNAWLQVYGTPFTTEPMVLTNEELKQLPTIILQFQGHADSNTALQNDPTASEYLASFVDTNHPQDILLVLSPSIYMEFEDGKYVSSIHFDEPESNVFGANIMTNYDVHFDIDLQRIGFAESSCNYTLLMEPSSTKTNPNNYAAKSIHSVTSTATLQLQSDYIDETPSIFFVFAASAIGFFLFILASRKTTTTITHSSSVEAERVTRIRRGRRRHQPQPQPQDQLIHRIRMVARSISRDRADFINSLSQPSGSSVSSNSSSSSTHHNPTPARRHKSFGGNSEPNHSLQLTSGEVGHGAGASARIDQENCSTTAAHAVSDGRRTSSVLRSRSYHISSRDGAV